MFAHPTAEGQTLNDICDCVHVCMVECLYGNLIGFSCFCLVVVAFVIHAFVFVPCFNSVFLPYLGIAVLRRLCFFILLLHFKLRTLTILHSFVIMRSVMIDNSMHTNLFASAKHWPNKKLKRRYEMKGKYIFLCDRR